MIYVLVATTVVCPILVYVAMGRLLAAARDESRVQRLEATVERRELLNRIKPETAQYAIPKHVADEGVMVDLDDDNYFEDLTKEQLAAELDAVLAGEQ